MSTPPFDADGLFDEDYLFFYQDVLTDDASDEQARLITRLCGLGPGMRALDLACGHGRIANRLAALGCQVTGLDRSRLFLDLAKEDAARRGVDVTYVEGDMRTPPAGPFDVVISWFTSFGYFDDEDNKKVLREVCNRLAPSGVLLLESVNLLYIARNFQHSIVRERDGSFMIDKHRFQGDTGRTVVERTIIRDGKTRRVPYFTRLFTCPELSGWLREAGFADVRVVDEHDEPISLTSRRLIAVATAPG